MRSVAVTCLPRRQFVAMSKGRHYRDNFELKRFEFFFSGGNDRQRSDRAHCARTRRCRLPAPRRLGNVVAILLAQRQQLRTIVDSHGKRVFECLQASAVEKH